MAPKLCNRNKNKDLFLLGSFQVVMFKRLKRLQKNSFSIELYFLCGYLRTFVWVNRFGCFSYN